LNGRGAQEFRGYDEAWTSERQIHLIDHVAVESHAVYGEGTNEIRADTEPANVSTRTWSIQASQKSAATMQAKNPAYRENGS